jgi:endonuclease/exonuclease/phosphatase family metal-dependent hydrolase
MALPLMAFAALAAAGCHTTPPRSTAWDEAVFTVATYNLFACRIDHEAGERMIREIDADVVFLQEVTECWGPVFESMRNCYPHQFSSGDTEGLGNALLSRLPLIRIRNLPAEHGWHGAWFAVVDTPVGPVQLLGVHLAPPLTADNQFSLGALLATGRIHRREIQDFTRDVDFDAPLIILGDFNENERGAAAMWVRLRGLRSALMQFDPFSPTWAWDEDPGVTARLDHIFHSPDLELTHAQVIPGGASDHQPVVAAFGPNGRSAPPPHPPAYARR